jgi:2-oxoglutarate dehydrogenase complex dehydrogenase (E1) component-like enzyme
MPVGKNSLRRFLTTSSYQIEGQTKSEEHETTQETADFRAECDGRRNPVAKMIRAIRRNGSGYRAQNSLQPVRAKKPNLSTVTQKTHGLSGADISGYQAQLGSGYQAQSFGLSGARTPEMSQRIKWISSS